MNRLFKANLIILFSVIAMAVPVSFAFAQPANLVVDFENEPLFSEANFLPGDTVIRWVKVTNNTPETKKIIVEAININDNDGLGDVFNLKIKEGTTLLYDDTLSDFFDAGEVVLSDLAGNSSQTQYDFEIYFNLSSGDDYQEKQVGFDFLIGFQGEEGEGDGGDGLDDGPFSFGGDWGANGPISLSPGLTIFNENAFFHVSSTILINGKADLFFN